MHSRYRLLAVTLSTVVCLSGCSKSSPLAPRRNGAAAFGDAQARAAFAASRGWASFYPLDLGNSWSYEGGGMLRVVSAGRPPYPDYSYAFTESHRLIGTTHHEGTAYVVEEQVHHQVPESPYGPATWWDRLRQDRKGLYSLDTLLQSPPPLDGNQIGVARAGASGNSHPYRIDVAAWRGARASDASLERFANRVETMREAVRGVIRGDRGRSPPTGLELRRLVYPLRPGTSWSIRPDFPWPARVNRFEILETPAGRFPAFRIEINPFGTLIHEGEWVRVWYSRKGYLGYSIHTIFEGTNPDGSPSGITYVADEGMKVASVQIVRKAKRGELDSASLGAGSN